MSEYIVYEYDKKNRNKIKQKLKERHIKIMNLLTTKENYQFEERKEYYLDASSLFNYDKIDVSIAILEKFFEIFEDKPIENIKFMVEKEYSRTLKDNLYYFIEKICSLEQKLDIKTETNKSIVEIDEKEFEALKEEINNKIYGNENFKKRLIEEIENFRIFNKINMQAILSVFVFGKPGIGKTETARVIHSKLYGQEDIIKLNFENYSGENALSSLIGSPRGYIGSEHGELSEKIAKSQSKIIIIDEFEKASKPVFNFFLQLLEEGKFTDSLGREYNLNEYVIYFTSNIETNKLHEKISPELFSRFNLIYKMTDISIETKKRYVSDRIDYINSLLKNKNIKIENKKIKELKDLDVSRFEDLRKINNTIRKLIGKEVYNKFHPKH